MLDTAEAAEAWAGSSRRWWLAAAAFASVGVVLRVWGLGSQPLTFDEAFTGAAARRPLDDMVGYLATSDSHPPLDYFIRRPFAATASEAWLRLPSVVFSIATLAVLAWWMRGRGRFGATTVMVASVTPSLVLHGREARMYALAVLLGVVLAWLADRWWVAPTARRAVAISVVSLLALMTLSAALLPVGALLLLPRRRSDRAAWQLRLAVLAALCAWAVLWGWAFLDQSSGRHAGWIPPTSWEWTRRVLAGTVSNRIAGAGLIVALIVAGACLLRPHRRLGTIAALAFALPFLAAAVVGIERPLLVPRAFAFGYWVPVVCMAALIDAARRHLPAAGFIGAAVVVAVATVPSTVHIVAEPQEPHEELPHLRGDIDPGDRVAIGPSWFAPILQWELVAKDGYVAEGVDELNRFVVRRAGGRPSGVTYVLTHVEHAYDAHLLLDGEPCGAPFRATYWVVWCVESSAQVAAGR